MGARPSTFKKGGGFLNNVDGKITGYQFTDEFNGEAFVPGKDKAGKDKFHSLNFVLSVRVDGATEDVTTTLFAGGYDNYDVSEDGLTLTAPDGGECGIGANTALGKFVTSWCAAAGTEDDFDDDPNSVNFEPMIGRRIRFIQANISKEDEDKLIRAGKSVKRAGKDGKTYNRQNLQVAAVYDDVPKTTGKTSAKTSAKAAPSKLSLVKGNSVKGKAPVESIADRAGVVLQGILGKAKDNVIARDDLSMAILKAIPKDPQRDAIREHLNNSDNVEAYDFAVYDEGTESIGLVSA